ncbi:MAG: ABC transporter, partial [Endozoicomonas sp. (ex Botrylloides leachii)]|nr:ABC transporter [Endozoicomonas sp. (ex Botrylloides leachii)]
AWGVTFDEKKVVADAKNALPVGSPSGRPVRHLGILGLSEASFNKEDVVTSSLTSINLATAGAIYPLDGAETTFETLLRSSKNSMLMNADAFSAMMDPSSLYKDFVPSGNEYTLIARVTGQVKTAYPNGQPKEETTEDAKDKDSNAKQPANNKEKALDKKQVKDAKPKKADNEKLKSVHLVTSEKPINVIIVTDTDILTDRLWVQKSRFFGREIIQPFANNGDLLINMVDNLLGNADLISIRSRGQFARPFDRLNKLEQAAEANYHKKEDQLKKQLSETESKLHELQMKKQGVEKLTLNAEQTEELEKFMQEKLKIRKELREVQHQLGKNIEHLATTLKLINIFAVPVLITLVFFSFRFYRRKLRK